MTEEVPQAHPVEIATLASIAHYILTRPEKEIIRENFLNSVEELLERGVDVVVVEGDEGYGKTTLLDQLSRRLPLTAFPLFLNSGDAMSREVSLITFDLANQIHWLLTGQELGREISEVDSGLLRTELFHLARQARRTARRYVFVIDGLNDLPQMRDAVIEMLPFRKSGFRFVIAGSKSDFVFPTGTVMESVRLTGFVGDETRQYLSDLVDDVGQVEEIHRIFRGIPGRLASVRRLLLAGTPSDEILREPFATARELFEREWKALGDVPDADELVFSILAFDTRPRTLAEIGAIAERSNHEIKHVIQRAPFLVVAPNQTVSFTSEAFRRYVSQKLQHLKGDAIGRIIAFFATTAGRHQFSTRASRVLRECWSTRGTNTLSK